MLFPHDAKIYKMINLKQSTNYIQIKVANQHENCFILTDNFDELHDYLNQHELSKQIFFKQEFYNMNRKT